MPAAVMRVLRVASQYLSDDLHYETIRSIIEAWLQAAQADDNEVDFDPAEVGEEIGRIIVDDARKRALQYQSTGRPLHFEPGPYSIDIIRTREPGAEPPPPRIEELEVATASSFAPGAVVRGFDGHLWNLALHAAYAFDSLPELRFAWLVDHDGGVDWWVRNQPRRLRIATPAGLFSPDFIIRMKDGVIMIIEVKGSIYWTPPDSEAQIKAKCAARWALAETELSGNTVKFGVALDSDVESSASFAVLRERLRST